MCDFCTLLFLSKSPFLKNKLLRNTIRLSNSLDPNQARPEVIKLFPCSTQLSTKFILLINVKMPIVGILTFISMINTKSERLKARNFFICRYSSLCEQLKFVLSCWKKFMTLGPGVLSGLIWFATVFI